MLTDREAIKESAEMLGELIDIVSELAERVAKLESTLAIVIQAAKLQNDVMVGHTKAIKALEGLGE
jgi:hypothetical protein